MKPNSTIKKLEFEKSESIDSIQITFYKNLLFNPTKHILVPRHIKLEDNEVSKIIDRYKLSSKIQIPIILKDDPIVRYYNFKSGDVLKIEKRVGVTNFNYNNYRYVR